MRSKLILLLLAGLTTVVSCKTNNPTQPSANAPQAAEASASPATEAKQPLPISPAEAATAKPRVDACALISGQEIQSVQGEAVKETKLSGQSADGFDISQCFFSLPPLPTRLVCWLPKGEKALVPEIQKTSGEVLFMRRKKKKTRVLLKEFPA